METSQKESSTVETGGRNSSTEYANVIKPMIDEGAYEIAKQFIDHIKEKKQKIED